jgi:hypothetical protein
VGDGSIITPALILGSVIDMSQRPSGGLGRRGVVGAGGGWTFAERLAESGWRTAVR